MAKIELCAFGKEIDHKLVDIDREKSWLIDMVKKDTGMFFDRSYLHKIKVGTSKNARAIKSICKILDIQYQKQ